MRRRGSWGIRFESRLRRRMAFDVMQEMKTGVTDLAYEFRHWLSSDLTKAESLLSKHPELINQAVYGGSESALHFFAVEDEVDIVAWLLARGANPNGIDGRNFPIHEAAQVGNLESCRILLAAGANPNIPDFIEETALHKASSSGHLEIIELLLASGADPAAPDMCGELPVDHFLPRKKAEIHAIFKNHTNKKKA